MTAATSNTAAPAPTDAYYAINFSPPPLGAADAVTGRVTLPAGVSPAAFKLALLLSADAATWWRKDQEQYRYLQPAAAAAGGVLAGDGSFSIAPWVAPDQLVHDTSKPWMRLLLLPAAFDLLAHPVEGVPLPQAFLDAAFASTTVSRLSNEVTRDAPGELGRATSTPAATRSASPTWTRPAVDFACICAPRLAASSALDAVAAVAVSAPPIRLVGASRRGGANAVAVGAALTLGLALAGPADRSCPRNVSSLDDVYIARASVRIVAGYSGPAEDGLYLARGALPRLSATGLVLTYGGGRRQRLLLSPRDEGVRVLSLAAYVRAVRELEYRNEMAGTAWQTAGVRSVEAVFFDGAECSSTVLRQEVDVVAAAAGVSS